MIYTPLFHIRVINLSKLGAELNSLTRRKASSTSIKYCPGSLCQYRARSTRTSHGGNMSRHFRLSVAWPLSSGDHEHSRKLLEEDNVPRVQRPCHIPFKSFKTFNAAPPLLTKATQKQKWFASVPKPRSKLAIPHPSGRDTAKLQRHCKLLGIACQWCNRTQPTLTYQSYSIQMPCKNWPTAYLGFWDITRTCGVALSPLVTQKLYK